MVLDQMTKLEGGRYQDVDGQILPWYTSPCLEWLMGLDLVGKKVFEFGLGDSTLWYVHNGAESYGVDSEISWCLKVGTINKGYEHTTFMYSYITSIKKYPFQFDFIVIDGDYRDRCTEQALKYLKPGGFLILENYKQPSVEEHWPITEKLIEGMPITIYKEPEHYDWQTAVITKP